MASTQRAAWQSSAWTPMLRSRSAAVNQRDAEPSTRNEQVPTGLIHETLRRELFGCNTPEKGRQAACDPCRIDSTVTCLDKVRSLVL